MVVYVHKRGLPSLPQNTLIFLKDRDSHKPVDLETPLQAQVLEGATVVAVAVDQADSIYKW